MLQIPVEGGHRGGDLTVKHDNGDTKLDRSHENGQKFYLSASFIDCAHTFSPVTKGWSVSLTYYLTWKHPLLPSPHRTNLPTFISSLKTVEQILTPFVSPDENCDTDMLVIPLVNDYAKTLLNYENLRGTDKLMANILQSTKSLEIRLVTLVNYRAGTANDVLQMNTDRNGDDAGYPNSPIPLELDDDETITKSSRRFIADELIQSCYIEDSLRLDGEVDEREMVPVNWKEDYIFRNVESDRDLFDEVSPPDREKYNRYHDVEFELQQWWYKPFLIISPKSSTALKCRKNFGSVVNSLKERISQHQSNIMDSEADRMAQLSEFREIVHYFYHYNEEYEDDSKLNYIQKLFSICNFLKAKEEGISLCRYYAENVANVGLKMMPDFAEYVGFAGWNVCKRFFTSYFTGNSPRLEFLIPLTFELLNIDSSLSNEAAVVIFNKILTKTFPSVEALTAELFNNNLNSIRDNSPDLHSRFLVIIFTLEQRRLFEHVNNRLVSIASFHLVINSKENLNLFVTHFCSCFLASGSSFKQLTFKLQYLLMSLCRSFLESDIHSTHPYSFVVSWISLFVFVGRRTFVQQLKDKICSRPSGPLEEANNKLFQTLKNILSQEKLQKDPKLKNVRGKLKRTFEILLKRRRYEFRQSVSYLKSVVSRLDRPYHPFVAEKLSFEDVEELRQLRTSQLRDVVDLRLKIPLHWNQLSSEEAEEEFVCMCNLIELCNKLESKDEVLRLIGYYTGADASPVKKYWFRPELLSVLAGFVIIAGWKEFANCYLSIKRCFIKKLDTLQFLIGLTNEMLLLNILPQGDDTAAEVFDCFTSLIGFPSFEEDSSTEDFKVSKCLDSNLDEKHRLVLFHAALLLTDKHMECNAIVKSVIRCLMDRPIDFLRRFIKMWMSSGALVRPFEELLPSCQTTLEHVFAFDPQTTTSPISHIEIDFLLDCMRLTVYMGNIFAGRLMQQLSVLRCSNESHNAFIKLLLVNNQFQTDSQLKIFRENSLFVRWKRQQKKSFFKFFFLPTNSKNIKKKTSVPPYSSEHCHQNRQE